MKNYSIVRIGNEYIVQAREKSVFKIASRRRAVKLVADAAELLESHSALSADHGASITRDDTFTPVPSKVP